MPKWGVEFVSPDHDHIVQRRIRRGLGQVDALCLAGAPLRNRRDPVSQRRHAGRADARRLPRARGRASTPTAPTCRPRWTTAPARSWRARFVIDASGRDTFLANKLKAKQKNPQATTARRCSATSPTPSARPGKLEGNITIFWFAARLVLVHPAGRRHHQRRRGVLALLPQVAQQAGQGVLRRHDRDVPAAGRARSKDATLVDDAVYATGNYSYTSTHCSGERYLMLGDAFTFIDPVFSSGVYLAMHSAFEGVGGGGRRARPPARRGGRARSASSATCARDRASSRGSSSASPTRPCANSSCTPKTRCA